MNDPIKHCKLYKEIGCSHVDGMLCDFPKCSMLKEYEESKLEIEKDEFAPNALPLVDATTAMDVFENAIRVYGVGNFAEYVGADYYGEFATDQLQHLKDMYRAKGNK